MVVMGGVGRRSEMVAATHFDLAGVERFIAIVSKGQAGKVDFQYKQGW